MPADDGSDGNNAASMPTVLSASQARAAVTGSGLTPAWLSSPARQSAEPPTVNAEPSPPATPPDEEPPDEEPPRGRKKERTKSSVEPPAAEPGVSQPGGALPPTLGDYGLAAWRACFYVLMYFHWRNSEVHAPPAYESRMFGYDQFWWVPQLMPQDPAVRVRANPNPNPNPNPNQVGTTAHAAGSCGRRGVCHTGLEP